MSINERINVLIETLGLTPRAFSIKIGIEPANFHNIISGRKTEPKHHVLEKILIEFPQISAYWLILGEGEMLRNSEKENASIKNLQDENAELKVKVKTLTDLIKELKK